MTRVGTGSTPLALRWIGRSLGLALAVAMAATACGGGDDPNASFQPGQGGSGAGVIGDECEDGESRECKVMLPEHNGVKSCFVGVSTCAEGSWGECVEGDAEGLSAKSYSPAGPCTNNPCDPECKTFDETPPTPWDTGSTAPDFNWSQGSWGNIPASAIAKTQNEPCQTGLDCQQNTYCWDPKNGSCAHDICELGAGLLPGCNDCVDIICANHPQCCEKPYGGSTCSHSECTTGGPLAQGCSACVDTVCAADPYCCNNGWDSICVGEAESWCGSTCGGTAGCAGQGCAHDVCTTGSALTSGCDPCVASVCGYDSYCCNFGWDSICVNEAANDPACGSGSCAGQSCVHNVCTTGSPLAAGCDPCVASVCSYDAWCCNNGWDSLCVSEAAADPACQSAPSGSACAHDPCVQGAALADGCANYVSSVCASDPSCCSSYWGSQCVTLFNQYTPGGCPSSWPGSWDQTCVDAVQSECHAYCKDPPPPTNTGECMPWSPGITDPDCAGYDLAVGYPCTGKILVCNHGTQQAPAGIPIYYLPSGQNQFGNPTPTMGLSGSGTCTTASPIDPGFCIEVTTCSGLMDGYDVMVNPGPSSFTECNPWDNWGKYYSGPCGEPVCGEIHLSAELTTVNMFIQVDKSGSMGTDSRWTKTKNAFTAFFQQAVGLNAALEFFPYSASGQKDGCYNGSAECSNPVPCSNPYVPLCQLKANSPPADGCEKSFIDAFNAFSPGGGTPLLLAQKGATQWAINKSTATPDEQQVIVLVTDGEPTYCGTNQSSFTQVAADAYNNYGILTYAVGIVGANQALLDAIATAGGGQAFFIDNANNIQNDLVAAMNSISGDVLTCNLAIPQGYFDPEDAQVFFSPMGGATPTPVVKVADGNSCTTDGGWWLDTTTNEVVLCPQTCNKVIGSENAQLDVFFPCQEPQPVTYTQSYQATCPAGLTPQWGYFAYDTTAPGASQVVFEGRSAATQAGLANATSVPLATAQSTPTDTQVCTMAPNGSCPIDLFVALGQPDAHDPWFELIATLYPDSGGPSVNNWQITYSCVPLE